jgi:hypothetical protein
VAETPAQWLGSTFSANDLDHADVIGDKSAMRGTSAARRFRMFRLPDDP